MSSAAPPFQTVNPVPPLWDFNLKAARLIRDDRGRDGLFEVNAWFYLALVCELYCDFLTKPAVWAGLPVPRRAKRFINLVRRAISDATPSQTSQQPKKNHFAGLLWDHLKAERILDGGAQGGYGRQADDILKLLTAFSRHIVATVFQKSSPCGCGTAEHQKAYAIVVSTREQGWAIVAGQDKHLRPLT